MYHHLFLVNQCMVLNHYHPLVGIALLSGFLYLK